MKGLDTDFDTVFFVCAAHLLHVQQKLWLYCSLQSILQSTVGVIKPFLEFERIHKLLPFTKLAM